MAYDNKGLVLPFEAGADLSAKQHYLVYLDSALKIQLVDAITRPAIGILQNKPDASGKEASVCVGGVSKIVLGATLAAGVLVGPAATGKAAADASTNYTVGMLLKGGADTEKGTVLLRNYTAKA